MKTNTRKPITLIATIGSSPAVLTEALHELYHSGEWPVKDIIIVTTAHGKHKLEESLYSHPDGGIYRWCREFEIPPHNLNLNDQWVIPKDNKGKELNDIRNSDDDKKFAEIVQETVRKVCQREDRRVFGLLSGGRKTMSAHLFSAMQLFAQPDDRLIHILVSEPFDQIRDFYYPTTDSTMLRDRNGKEFDASNAELTLINIPFLRLRGEMEKTNLDFNQSYPELLKQVEQQLRLASDKTIRNIHIDITNRTIYINGRKHNHAIKMQPRPLSLIIWMALRNIEAGKTTSLKLGELENSDKWLIHLIYYLLTKVEAEKDAWFKDPEMRNISKAKTILKNTLIEGFKKIDWQHPPQFSHLLNINNARYADLTEYRLLIPPENIRIYYNGPLDPVKKYLTQYRNADVDGLITDSIINRFKRLINHLE